HLAALRVRADDVAGLALRADKEKRAAVGGELARELERLLVHRQGLLEVDDVNLVAVAEDERRHLRIPVPGLMSEMDPGFQHLTHRHRHSTLLRVRSAAPSKNFGSSCGRSTLKDARDNLPAHKGKRARNSSI